MNNIITLNEILNDIKKNQKKDSCIVVGIDGGGGAGKSTFSKALKSNHPDNIDIVEMDDLYKESKFRNEKDTSIGSNWDLDRVVAQVLAPLKNNNETQYQRYDWDKDMLDNWIDIEKNKIVLVEGCYSLSEKLNSYYDYKIWVESPEHLRLNRGVERDGEENRYMWEDIWMPDEVRYIQLENPRDTVDLILDGSGETVSYNQNKYNGRFIK
ncbi:uridine kinase family protein [Salinicoccus sp. CNSTN-B1]